MTRLLAALSVLLLTLGSLARQCASQEEASPPVPPPQLSNGGVEEGEVGKPPTGWIFSSNNDASVVVEDAAPFEGKQYAAIDASAPASGDRPFTNLSQSLDATLWQGQRVRYRVAVRVADMKKGSTTQLWMRVDRAKGEDGSRQMGAFDNMGDRPIRNKEWQQHDIVLDIHADATRIIFGVFVIGTGKAWIDGASIEAVTKETKPTGASERGARPQRSPALSKALASAKDAPQQPFFTLWLILPLLAFVMFGVAMWPTRTSAEQERVGTNLGILRWFGMYFTASYWLLYCLPGPFSRLLPTVGAWLSSSFTAVKSVLVHGTASAVFDLQGDLLPPNGSGDTTYSYIHELNVFVISVVLAAAFTFGRFRKVKYEVLVDLLRSYLRYVLAFAMLGYGLAKASMVGNQFPIIGEWQLNKAWGESSPMNVVWSFMGASRPYTIFAGLSEVFAAMLLIWRRTGTLGAMVAVAVMTNVVMLNYCYDVPVKLYSTNLLMMGVVIMAPDIHRLASVLLFNRSATANLALNVWAGSVLRWVRIALKAAVIGFGFAWPIWQHVGKNYDYLYPEGEVAAEAEEDPSAEDERPLLVRRGYRWINEVPFNR